ncbi:MAG: DNA-directed DNA polymerase II small subunit [Candidatus Syntropharchaeales archaeon]
MLEVIVERFAREGYQLHPDAARILCEERIEDGQITNILNSIDDSTLVITPKDISSFCERFERRGTGLFNPLMDTSNLRIVTEGGEGFVRRFCDRYEKLSRILQGRLNVRSIKGLERIKKQNVGKIGIVGMVSEINKTQNGHTILDLEDMTGRFPVLLLKDKLNENIILDEVIGVQGSLTKEGELLVAEKILFPDVPSNFRPNHAQEESFAVLISDIHLGNLTFIDEAWEKFISWMRGELGGPREVKASRKVRYLVIAGDVVDGIGVYPNQEEELVVTDLMEQYRMVAESLARIPEHIKIIIAPGNHDAVRQADPQPQLPERIQRLFKDHKNTAFVSNPAIVELDGVSVMIYHGQSFDDLIMAIPGLSYDHPDEVMIEMLKRRHLSPIYGGKVPIVPAVIDSGVIERVPDILHCGHTHTVGVGRYRGVTVINAGTWQGQTEYQKKLNITPVPGCAALVNLKSLDVNMLKFR